jgi:hypothetical protein
MLQIINSIPALYSLYTIAKTGIFVFFALTGSFKEEFTL